MEPGTRRLVAIMFSDIAGYTALMGEDEERAVRALELSRSVVKAQVEKHGGRLLEEIGDGTLSSFDSAVSAVECAREIQAIIGPEPDFDLRIGIHIGDVLIGGDDSSAIGVFTSLIIPDASPIQQDVMNQMFAMAMTGEDAARFLDVLIHSGDNSSLLPKIRVSTLVVHARGDRLVPFEAGGREFAAGIPGAKLVVLETDNHGFGPTDPTYPQYLQALDDFLAEDPELAERY